MGGGSSVQSINCPANQWTNVIWYAGFIWSRKYRVTVPEGTTVDWREYGAGIPPYWQGSFTTTDTFTWWPWNVYMRVDIKPKTTLVAQVSIA
jgi:hypothetical protein